MAVMKGSDFTDFQSEDYTVTELPKILKQVIEESKGKGLVDIEFSGRVADGKIIITDMSYNSPMVDITQYGDSTRPYMSDLEEDEDDLWELEEDEEYEY
jgi:hypothetical protein